MKNYFYYWVDLAVRQRIGIALGKGTAGSMGRTVSLSLPSSWEFSGFSQNGEDGILDVLRRQMRQRNQYVIELGSADGLENNSAWLIVVEKFHGLMIEGNPKLVARAKRNMTRYSLGAKFLEMFVTLASVPQIVAASQCHDPDILSVDIDGNDFHIAKALFEQGLRPRIFVAEYNSTFGPEKSITVPYDDRFSIAQAHPTQLYYGVSISAWKKLLTAHGYRFITVDRNGVNAFFVDPQHFDASFLDTLEGQAYVENKYQQQKFGLLHREQFAFIADMPFHTV